MKRQVTAAAIVFIIIFFIQPGINAQQGETKMTISYTVASPMGSFKDFVSKTTGRAGDIDILYGVSDKLSVGGAVGFRDFYEKLPRQVYKGSDGSDISAVLSNAVQTVPLMAKLKYNFSPTAAIQPFVSAGVGASFVRFSQYAGEYVNVTVDKVAFTASPAAGMFIPFGKQTAAGLNLAAAFHYMPFNDDYSDNLNHMSIQLGVSFPLRE